MIKDLIEIKEDLLNALDQCGTDEDNLPIDAPDMKLTQDFRITDKLVRNGRGVVIVKSFNPSQSIKIQIIQNITNAIRKIDKLQQNISDSSEVKSILESVILECIERGQGYKEIRDGLSDLIINTTLDNSDGVLDASRKLKIAHGTIHAHKKRMKKIENMEGETK